MGPEHCVGVSECAGAVASVARSTGFMHERRRRRLRTPSAAGIARERSQGMAGASPVVQTQERHGRVDVHGGRVIEPGRQKDAAELRRAVEEW